MTSESLKILYICSEATPFIKTGGLADVSNALPRALRALGHDVRIALPCYGTIPEELRGTQVATCRARLDSDTVFGALRETTIPDSDVPVYLVEHDIYFMRDHPYGRGNAEYSDNLERFCFFSLAALDGVPQTGWTPDVIHCNDWHTAAIPAYIKTHFLDHPAWKGKASVFTIHNMAYQGRYPSSLMPKTGLGWELFTPRYLEYYGDLNLMKAGIMFASKINTVSPTYAKEIQTPIAGCGLEGVLRSRTKDLSGISNGVDHDVWNPAKDPLIDAKYSIENIAGKKKCKRALQKRLGLPTIDAPLFGMVSRLVSDKGIDLLLSVLESFLAMDVQIVIQGTGDAALHKALEEYAANFPEKFSVNFVYDEKLAHQIYAGSDFYLMPSRNEPCGLSQLYSMAYGSIPVVHKTGGLADSVTDATSENLASGKATGFSFKDFKGEELLATIDRALAAYRDPAILQALQKTGMKTDWSWGASAKAYVDLFRKAMAAP
ncbi:MAG: glycogen synthase GlgA [Candidatus Hydrogenedentes bacterium]|nr:glycogen synthase GlgA [Candidatus Hydrogenedentota bacterium]